jgi:cytochrome P450
MTLSLIEIHGIISHARPKRGAMRGSRSRGTEMTEPNDIYFDPYDFAIDENPYPVWKRMRDERPLYHNEKYDFFALSRFSDVEAALKDTERLISGKGTLLELIRSNASLPPGMVIFEDPPSHDCYRGLLSRVFTPKMMNALEPKVRTFCADALDPLAGAERFDFVDDLRTTS